MIVRAGMFPENSKTFRVCVAYGLADTPGDDDYLYAEWVSGTGNPASGTLRIGTHNDGIDTILDSMSVSISLSVTVNIVVCYEKPWGDNTGKLSAYMAQASPVLGLDKNATISVTPGSEITDLYDTYYAGVENPGGSDIQFENFSVEEHYNTNPDCMWCGCNCESLEVSDTLTLTVVGTGCFSHLDGHTISFTANPLNNLGHSTIRSWDMTGEVICGTSSWDMRLLCSSGAHADPSEYKMCMVWVVCVGQLESSGPDVPEPSFDLTGCGAGGWNKSMRPNTAESTCDPTNIVFGPYNVTSPQENPVCPPASYPCVCCQGVDCEPGAGTIAFHFTQ
jgi:hypothetical protein